MDRNVVLSDFIIAHRDELITLTRAKVARRLAPKPTERELVCGVPLFLDQLAETLHGEPTSVENAIDRGAAAHGAALLNLGYTVAQVVHDYGDVCQAITELALDSNARIATDEFHTLNLCLDNAIAQAVTEYTRLRERSLVDGETERSGLFAHELRNRLSAAQFAFQAIKSGRAPVAGSVASLITRNLHGMKDLVDQALLEVRLDSGTARRQRVHVQELLEEAEVDGMMEAGTHGVSLSVAPTDRRIDVHADPHILAGAVANVLQNAFKFTPAGGHVSVRTAVTDGHVAIEIEDQCGGLPEGKVDALRGAFAQAGSQRKGLGHGLFVSFKGVKASGGEIRVRDVPGRGCVFGIDLPLLPATA
jgi:signal transduction histidine kinase